MNESTIHGIQFLLEGSTLLTLLGGIWMAARWTATRETNEAQHKQTLDAHVADFKLHVDDDKDNFAIVHAQLSQLSVSSAVQAVNLANLKGSRP